MNIKVLSFSALGFLLAGNMFAADSDVPPLPVDYANVAKYISGN